MSSGTNSTGAQIAAREVLESPELLREVLAALEWSDRDSGADLQARAQRLEQLGERGSASLSR